MGNGQAYTQYVLSLRAGPYQNAVRLTCSSTAWCCCPSWGRSFTNMTGPTPSSTFLSISIFVLCAAMMASGVNLAIAGTVAALNTLVIPMLSSFANDLDVILHLCHTLDDGLPAGLLRDQPAWPPTGLRRRCCSCTWGWWR